MMNTTQSIHPAIEIGQVHLKVSNLERSITFYKEVIGFQILKQVNRTAELSVDGKNAILVLEEIPNAVAMTGRRRTTGLYHFAILVPSRLDLSLSLRNLLKHQIEIGQGDHLVSEALYLNDPDKIGIEIYADRPRETWELDHNKHIKMATDPVDMQSLYDEGHGHVWSGLAEGTTIGHVHLHVADLTREHQFYCQMLGFDVVAQMPSALFISAGGYHHHIGMNTWAGVGAPPAPDNAVGLKYYTIVIPNQGELDRILQNLQDAHIPLTKQDGDILVQDYSNNNILLVNQFHN